VQECLPADESPDFGALLRQVRDGSEEAAWELVGRYGEMTRRAVRRVLDDRLRAKFDSLDFVQIVWSSLFRARGKLERFQRPEELAAYLVTMARNKVFDEARHRLATEKRNIDRECPLDSRGLAAQPAAVDPRPGPLDVAIARERWENLLRDQPVHYRRIIQLRLQGHTNDAIAKILQLDESTVRRFLKRLLRETEL
jgi:RNA polymerase sigma factor (sigma-70 family)